MQKTINLDFVFTPRNMTDTNINQGDRRSDLSTLSKVEQTKLAVKELWVQSTKRLKVMNELGQAITSGSHSKQKGKKEGKNTSIFFFFCTLEIRQERPKRRGLLFYKYQRRFPHIVVLVPFSDTHDQKHQQRCIVYSIFQRPVRGIKGSFEMDLSGWRSIHVWAFPYIEATFCSPYLEIWQLGHFAWYTRGFIVHSYSPWRSVRVPVSSIVQVDQSADWRDWSWFDKRMALDGCTYVRTYERTNEGFPFCQG